jgi:hypothetical protein
MFIPTLGSGRGLLPAGSAGQHVLLHQSFGLAGVVLAQRFDQLRVSSPVAATWASIEA